jgi:hypothetical protein
MKSFIAFLIADRFDSWISISVVLVGVIVDGKGHFIQGIWRARIIEGSIHFNSVKELCIVVEFSSFIIWI